MINNIILMNKFHINVFKIVIMNMLNQYQDINVIINVLIILINNKIYAQKNVNKKNYMEL